jgi:hypothetical protein
VISRFRLVDIPHFAIEALRTNTLKILGNAIEQLLRFIHLQPIFNTQLRSQRISAKPKHRLLCV